MGYTHYWKQTESADSASWGRYMAAMDALVDQTKVRLAFEYDQPKRAPMISTTEVRFNGVGEDGHETFMVEPQAQEFTFCKTARKPYDEVVVAALCLAAFYLPGFSWSSDGSKRNHQRGLGIAMELAPGLTETGCDYSRDSE